MKENKYTIDDAMMDTNEVYIRMSADTNMPQHVINRLIVSYFENLLLYHNHELFELDK